MTVTIFKCFQTGLTHDIFKEIMTKIIDFYKSKKAVYSASHCKHISSRKIKNNTQYLTDKNLESKYKKFSALRKFSPTFFYSKKFFKIMSIVRQNSLMSKIFVIETIDF